MKVDRTLAVQVAAALGIFAEAAEIEISIDDPSAPVRITADSDPDLIAVVMPMRI